MSEVKSNRSEQPAGDKPVNASRRKLTGAVLAGPVVLGTLASKQALGGTIPYKCTISGQISGTDSVRPGEAVNCNDLGRSPGFWMTHTNCWGQINPDAEFNTVFTCSTLTTTLKSVTPGSLEFAAVASYLNGVHFHTNDPAYPLSSDQVAQLYCDSKTGQLPAGFDLKTYFESLYDDGNNESWPDGRVCAADTGQPAFAAGNGNSGNGNSGNGNSGGQR